MKAQLSGDGGMSYDALSARLDILFDMLAGLSMLHPAKTRWKEEWAAVSNKNVCPECHGKKGKVEGQDPNSPNLTGPGWVPCRTCKGAGVVTCPESGNSGKEEKCI